MQAVHVPLHTPEEVRVILREAQAISAEFGEEPPLPGDVFRKSVDLLGARATAFVQPQAMPLNLSTLRNGG